MPAPVSPVSRKSPVRGQRLEVDHLLVAERSERGDREAVQAHQADAHVALAVGVVDRLAEQRALPLVDRALADELDEPSRDLQVGPAAEPMEIALLAEVRADRPARTRQQQRVREAAPQGAHRVGRDGPGRSA